jgi:hypothetical protein
MIHKIFKVLAAVGWAVDDNFKLLVKTLPSEKNSSHRDHNRACNFPLRLRPFQPVPVVQLSSKWFYM